MISRLQLNLRSDSVFSDDTSTLQTPSDSLDSKLQKNQLDSQTTSTTMSSFTRFFETTVTELGRDIIVSDDEAREENSRNLAALERRGDCESGLHIVVSDAEVEVEMVPIRSVNGGPADTERSLFSPEESEWLEILIQVSSAVADNQAEDQVQVEQ